MPISKEMKPKSSLKVRILLFCLIILALAIFAETGVRYAYYQRKSGHKIALVHFAKKLAYMWSKGSRTIRWDSRMYRDDPILGYSDIPGRHKITIQYTAGFGLIRKSWDFTAVLNEDGYRVTSDGTQYEGKPEIWIFGCSYTWGWPLDNEDTYPFLVQEQLPDYKIRNYAGNGYGTVHALLQMRRFLSEGNCPVICIIAYNHFHIERNVAAPSRLRQFVMFRDTRFHHPRAEIDESGKLQIKMVELKATDEPNPDPSYMREVTMRIFDEIKRLCDKYGIVPVCAFQTGTDEESVVQYCKNQGFHIIDMSVPLIPEYEHLPFDVHPNQAAHKMYASKLLKGLKEIIDNQ